MPTYKQLDQLKDVFYKKEADQLLDAQRGFNSQYSKMVNENNIRAPHHPRKLDAWNQEKIGQNKA